MILLEVCSLVRHIAPSRGTKDVGTIAAKIRRILSHSAIGFETSHFAKLLRHEIALLNDLVYGRSRNTCLGILLGKCSPNNVASMTLGTDVGRPFFVGWPLQRAPSI